MAEKDISNPIAEDKIKNLVTGPMTAQDLWHGCQFSLCSESRDVVTQQY